MIHHAIQFDKFFRCPFWSSATTFHSAREHLINSLHQSIQWPFMNVSKIYFNFLLFFPQKPYNFFLYIAILYLVFSVMTILFNTLIFVANGYLVVWDVLLDVYVGLFFHLKDSLLGLGSPSHLGIYQLPLFFVTSNIPFWLCECWLTMGTLLPPSNYHSCILDYHTRDTY